MDNAKPVDLNELIDALDLQSDFLSFFLHKESGEIITLTEDEIADVEEGRFSSSDEELLFAKEVLSDSGRYIELPWNLDKQGMMEEFCRSLDNEESKEALLELIQNADAFGHFNTAVHLYQVEDSWLEYIHEKLKVVAIEWCKENNLNYVDCSKEEIFDWL